MDLKWKLHLTASETIVLRALSSPAKIQDFLNTKIAMNFEEQGETCLSPRLVLQTRKAHCMEGAMLAALALRFHGHEPLVVDLEATNDDFDHVIAVFKQHGLWGAIGKTNHAVLRYREPVYRDIRELVMSYFHEYFMNTTGKKTLRKFAGPINLRRFDRMGWITSSEPVWYVPDFLAKAKHESIVPRAHVRRLRKADAIEIRAGTLTDEQPRKAI